MPLYEYRAIDKRGRVKKGVISASNLKVARDYIKGEGLYPTAIYRTNGEETKQTGGKKSFFFKGIFSKRGGTEFVYSMRHLSTLLSSGLTLDLSLKSTISQIKNSYLRKSMMQILEDIKGGMSFARAASKFPKLFPPSIIAMIEAGESSGSLDIVLEEIANLLENSADFKRKIITATVYPMFILVVGIMVVIFLLSFVVPKITMIFGELNQVLPLPTRILLFISSFFRSFWIIMVLFIISIILLFRFIYLRTKFRAKIDKYLFSIWIIGDIYKKIILARFSNILGMLLKNGITLINSLKIVKGISQNTIYQHSIDRIIEDVSQGKDLKSSMENSILFPSHLIQMISAGEESGRLDELLLKIGDRLEKEISSRLTIATSLLEPILILMLGGIVGFVVISILLPIFEMSKLVR
ncbi:type II secretion system inner membrane protein GspF [Desulfothermus okinawensis JCM 13304]